MADGRVLKWTLIGAVVAVIAACGIGVLIAYRSFMGDGDIGPGTLAAEEKAARAEGLPLEIEELLAKPPSDSNLNAAPVYREIGPLVRGKQPSNELFQAHGNLQKGTASAHEVALIRAELSAKASLLSRAIEASKRPSCVFERNWSLGPSMLLPEYADLKAVTKLLNSKAILASRAGRFEESEEALAASFRIGGHTGAEPLLIAYLVQISIDNQALAALETILDQNPSDPRVVAMAKRLLATLPKKPDFRRAVLAEIAMG